MHLFSGPDCEATWKHVCNHLRANGRECYNALVEIANPGHIDPDWIRRFNPRAIDKTFDVTSDVVNTIFPERTLANSATRSAFYARYKRAHNRRRHAHPGVWGTYFLRLIEFGDSGINQLERAIDSMSKWTKNHKAVIVLHLSSAETDGIRTRGGPCLQYIQLTCPTATSFDLVAVYRNHDYFNKAFGNFVGLARLMQFIATNTGRTIGALRCHSIHAYFDVSDANMNALLGQ